MRYTPVLLAAGVIVGVSHLVYEWYTSDSKKTKKAGKNSFLLLQHLSLFSAIRFHWLWVAIPFDVMISLLNEISETMTIVFVCFDYLASVG